MYLAPLGASSLNVNIPMKILFPSSKSDRKAEGSIFSPASSSCGSE